MDTSEPGADPRIEPCAHMVDKISALSDGSLRGIARWYTLFHTSYCARCRRALEALCALTVRLRNLAGLSADMQGQLPHARREAVSAQLDRIDAGD